MNPELIPLSEAARTVQIPKRTLQQACKDGFLVHVRKPRKGHPKSYFVREADVREWIARQIERREASKTVAQ